MATVSQMRAAGEKYLGADAAPEGLASYWSARAGRALATRPHELAEVGIDTPVAAYRELSFASTDGQGVRARVLLPKAEHGACEGKKKLATRAKELGLDAIHDTVHEMCKDEARHGCAFQGLLNRYFGK